MKKSKEFWVDLGYLDVLNSNVQAKEVVKADAAAAGIGLAAILVTGLIVGLSGGLWPAFCFFQDQVLG